MTVFVREYTGEADKDELQKWFIDIVNKLSPEDRILINIERQSDYEELLQVLVHEGAIVF